MSSIFASLNASSQSLAAIQRAIDISQNNVNNASTPGYATQLADFTALSFNANSGLSGGTAVDETSTRSNSLDQSVRSALSNLGLAQQSSLSLSGIETSFDVSGRTGIPGALTKLFSSFSALSVATGNSASRDAVVASAQEVASAFAQTSSDLSKASNDANQQIQSQLDQINALASQISGFNAQHVAGDAGADANLSAALEKLSSLANFSTRIGTDGGTDVLLDGQIPLVLGTQQFSLTSAQATSALLPANPAGTPALAVLDSNGQDVTSHFRGGSLAGLLQFRNSTLASLKGDRNQTGSLNTLAKGFADRVNVLLTSGAISEGPPIQAGLPIFTYDTSDATKTAGSLSVVSGFTGSQIATIDPGPPSISNGIALSLANLSNSASAADQINGFTYAQFFGEIAGGIGRQLSVQKDVANSGQQSATQAESLRAQLSGVSLDAEAVRLLQYQKSYSASAKLITVLDQITQSTLDILK